MKKQLTTVKVDAKLPFLVGTQLVWEVDESEQKAAWEIYVELMTRISINELKPEEGLLREALSSLYKLFDITRGILRKYGPQIAKPKGKDKVSLGYLSIAILNTVLRPVLAKWHPLLLDHEHLNPDNASSIVHEQRWDKHKELRQALEEVRIQLKEYADLLGKAANVPPFVIEKQ